VVATFPGRAFWPYWVPAKNFHFWLSHRFLPFWTYLDAICRI
jgi:hypothetical protein